MTLYALIALMVLLWSGNFIIGKFALREFPPLLLSGLRMVLAGLMIIPVYWWERRRKPDPVTRDDVRLLIGIGIFGLALNQVFFVFGLSRTTVAHSAIIIGVTPILVLLMAALRGQEQITGRKLAGMAIALGGVALLKALEGNPPGPRATWTGDLLTLAAVTTFSAFTVFGKTAAVRHSPVTVNTYAYVGAALGLAPVAGWQAWRFSFTHITIAGWASLLYMAMFSSVVCYLIYYYALSHMMPSRVSAFSYLQPPLVTTMGVFLLGEPLTASLIVSTAVILFGVYLAERG